MSTATLTLTAAAVLLLAASSSARASIEAGQGGASFDLGNITDTAENIMNQIIEQPAGDVPAEQAVDNFAAVIGFYLFGDRTLFYAKKTK